MLASKNYQEYHHMVWNGHQTTKAKRSIDSFTRILANASRAGAKYGNLRKSLHVRGKGASSSQVWLLGLVQTPNFSWAKLNSNLDRPKLTKVRQTQHTFTGVSRVQAWFLVRLFVFTSTLKVLSKQTTLYRVLNCHDLLWHKHLS